MHWPKAAGRIRDRGWNVYSCPWILGLTARLVVASEQAEPASEPGNRSLSSIRMHCQYRKFMQFMQEVHAVVPSNDCGERSDCVPHAGHSERGVALGADDPTGLGFLKPPPRQTY